MKTIQQIEFQINALSDRFLNPKFDRKKTSDEIKTLRAELKKLKR